MDKSAKHSFRFWATSFCLLLSCDRERRLLDSQTVERTGTEILVQDQNQDGGVGRHTAPPRTTRTDRESNSKGDQHQGNRK